LASEKKLEKNEMSASVKFKDKIAALSPEDQDRLVRMGWEDRTTFDVIELQFGLSPNEFVRFMRTQLNRSAFVLWRKRVHEQGRLKNEKTRGFKTTRFKSSRQSVDGITKDKK
jgi:uncharacterized protein (TIGR03643 family)